MPANSAWQQLNVLAHNLCRSFQLDTIAETKSISRKRTCTHLLHTIRTICFRVINKAGRLVRLNGRNALRMATNSTTQTLFEKLELALVSINYCSIRVSPNRKIFEARKRETAALAQAKSSCWGTRSPPL